MADVTIITVHPDALQDAPAAIGEGLARMMAERGDTFGVVLIGSRPDADRFAEINLWPFAPMVEVEPSAEART